MAALPILYSFRRCPYAMRARLALAASGVACELREVVLRNKPRAMLQASPKGTVPVLVLSAPGQPEVIDESLDIMRWALAQADPLGWLTPEQEDVSAMLALIAQCDGPFKHHLDRYKYPDRYLASARDAVLSPPGSAEPGVAMPAPNGAAECRLGDDTAAGRCDVAAADAPRSNAREDLLEYSARHRDAAALWLDALGRRLDAGYLFGSRPALADMAILPFVRQFAHVDDAWFAGRVPANVLRWLEGWENGPLFAAVMPKFAPWCEGEVGVAFP
ncbi:glutathione S-transferase [Pusillimonas sp. TS35]|nr:glutathione S-transferase [Pusillimonas sp. TS35]